MGVSELKKFVFFFLVFTLLLPTTMSNQKAEATSNVVKQTMATEDVVDNMIYPYSDLQNEGDWKYSQDFSDEFSAN